MKLWDIIKTVGGAVISSAVPGGGLLIGAINEMLPDDKKLPADATGNDVTGVIDSLPPDKRAEILSREFDVDITRIQESNTTVRAMLEADTKNPQTTRPYIARGAFHVIAFTIIVVISVWAYGVAIQDDKLVAAVMNGWQFVLAVIGPLVTLLWAYFGVLKQEHKNRLDAAGNKGGPSGIAGILGALLQRK